MKPAPLKIVILCEYFPPSGNTAAFRPYAWYTHFHRHGLYPVVFCRNYEEEAHDRIEQTAQGELHAIHLKPEPLQQWIGRSKGLVKYLLIMLNVLVENARWYGHAILLRRKADSYLQEHGADAIIASGSPYNLFAAASFLAAKHRIPWIADYRDDWTTNEVFAPNPLLRLLKKIDSFREKRFLASADFFLTVSAHYRHKLEQLTGRKGFVIENGYLPEEAPLQRRTIPDRLIILYCGLLYPSQQIRIVEEAARLLIQRGQTAFQFVFLGSDPKYLRHDPSLSEYFQSRPRVSRQEALNHMVSADLLLFLPFYGASGLLKGVPASKLYDYIYSKRPVLVCPTDGDVAEQKLKSTGQGIFCETSAELAQRIEQYIQQKLSQQLIPDVTIPEAVYRENSRAAQTQHLCELLTQHLKSRVS